VNVDISDEAVEYGRVARQALDAAGGDRLVQRAEQQPDRRESLVAPVLAELGAWDLDPRAGSDELEAAAALCCSSGWWAVPYPVADRLARPTDIDADGLVVVAKPAGSPGAGRPAPAAPLGGLAHRRWVAVTLDGRRHEATPRPLVSPPRKSAFVTRLDLRPLGDGDGAGEADVDVALGLVLSCWTLLGMLDRAVDLTRAYVLDRRQFGQPLASFQGVQFQLTDAETERAGAEELAKYALWSIESRPDEAVDDALALRLAAIEAAEVVFRVAHQLHGAIGFCDETTLSWLSRHSQPLRRLPLGLSATLDRLTRRIGRQGLSGLFDTVGSGWAT
jgi:3-oxo-4-pregnene-20-carboxyl-CoA dehydrogenase alpha subunit